MILERTTQPQTLIEKLEKKRDHHNHFLETCRNDRDKAYHSFGKKCYQEAINIVKQHQSESEWVNVDEYRKIAKANDRVFVYDTFCKAVMPSLVRVINGRAGFQLTNGLYAMHVSHVCSMAVPKPPSEVQDD